MGAEDGASALADEGTRKGDRLTALVRRVGGTFVLYGASVGLGYVFNILVARWSGTAEYGRYLVIWNLISLAMVPVSLGTAVSAVRYIPQLAAVGDHRRVGGFIVFSFAVTGLTAVLVGGLGALASIAKLLPPISVDMGNGALALLLVALIVTTSLGSLLSEMARASHNPWMAIAPQGVGRPILALGGIALFGMSRAVVSAAEVLSALAVAGAIMVVLQIIHIAVKFRAQLAGPKIIEAKSWLSTSLNLCVFSIVVGGLMQLDTLLVATLMGAKAAGIFGADYRVGMVVETPVIVGNMLALPVFSHLFAQKRLDDLQRKMRQLSHGIFWPGLAMAAGILIFSPQILRLFGHDFVAGQGALAWIAAASVVSAAFGPVSALVVVLDLQKSGLIVLVLTAVIDIVGNVLLIPKFGLEGAAAAYFASNLFRAATLNHLIKRRWGVSSSIFWGRAMTHENIGDVGSAGSKAYYGEESAVSFYVMRNRGVFRSYFSRLETEWLRSADFRGAIALDVGAAIGQKALSLRDHLRFIAIGDLSETMAQAAKAECAEAVNIGVACFSADQLPFADDSFDLVLGYGVFEAAQDPSAFLAEFRRVGRTGGFLCCTFPNAQALSPLSNPNYPTILRSAEDVRALLNSHDFEVVRQTTIFFLLGKWLWRMGRVLNAMGVGDWVAPVVLGIERLLSNWRWTRGRGRTHLVLAKIKSPAAMTTGV